MRTDGTVTRQLCRPNEKLEDTLTGGALWGEGTHKSKWKMCWAILCCNRAYNSNGSAGPKDEENSPPISAFFYFCMVTESFNLEKFEGF